MTMLRLFYATLILSPAVGALASGKKRFDACGFFSGCSFFLLSSELTTHYIMISQMTKGDFDPIAMVSLDRPSFDT